MSDKEKIEAGVQLYFDSLYESSEEKVRAIFHDAAMVSGYLPDGLHEMTLEDFAGFVAAQQPSPKDKGDQEFLEIISCEIVGDTAIVQIREAYLGMIFIDSFSFLKKEDTWRIYTKLFHVES